jgi:hypothetical protein
LPRLHGSEGTREARCRAYRRMSGSAHYLRDQHLNTGLLELDLDLRPL